MTLADWLYMTCCLFKWSCGRGHNFSYSVTSRCVEKLSSYPSHARLGFPELQPRLCLLGKGPATHIMCARVTKSSS